MLTVLRRIRKDLLYKNGRPRYFLYAFGEIILVVLGILIALQINNWNEGRKQRIYEGQFLSQLYSEMLRDSSSLERLIYLADMKAHRGAHVEDFFKPSPPTLDSMQFLHDVFFNGRMLQFVPSIPSYDALEANGELHIVRNDELVNLLMNYQRHLTLGEWFFYEESRSRKKDYNDHLFRYFNASIMAQLWDVPGNSMGITDGEIDDFHGYFMDFDRFLADPKSKFMVSTMVGVDLELAQYFQDIMDDSMSPVLEILRKEILMTEE